MKDGVLVPGAGKNVGGQGRRQRAARDKAEVARPGACHGGDEPRSSSSASTCIGAIGSC